MATFDKAIATILKNEGYLSDNKNDPGGRTKYGISFRLLAKAADLDGDGWQDGDINRDGIVNRQDTDDMSIEDAKRLYKNHFWLPNMYDKIQDQSIATKCLDMAVNFGGRWGNRIAQRAVRAAIGIELVEDGIMGNKTIHAINLCFAPHLMVALKSECAGRYRQLISINSKLKEFQKGWLNRAYSNPIKKD